MTGFTNRLFETLLGGRPHDAIAFESATGERFSYGDLDRATARVANVLSSLRVEPGARVAVQVEKSLAAVALYLGVVRAGGVFLPLNTAYTPREIEYFLADAEPALFVCDPEKVGSLQSLAQGAGARIETLDREGKGGTWAGKVIHASDAHEPAPRSDDDLAAILYTSGTTGRPKGAMLTHRNLASNAATLVECWNFTSEDVLLHALPIFHTHGLFVAVNTTLIAGARILLLPRFDTAQVVDLMPRATVMMGVPTFYTRLLDTPDFGARACAGVRLFISGSAPLRADTHFMFRERSGHAILERYGMTETNMITSNPYHGERRAGTVGFPLPGVGLRVVDPADGRSLESGEIGIVEVDGPNVFKGYWRRPEKSAEEFRSDGWFITGDMGVVDADGYLSIVGRDKDLIISGGYNVYPREVEKEIDALPGVVESAVVGVPHPDLGEGVIAVLVPARDVDLRESVIIHGLTNRIARYKQPKRVFMVSELPRNTMGKVQKNLLRERYAALFEASA